MKIIEEIRVVEQHTRTEFNEALTRAVNLLQGKNLEVKINNPHLVTLKPNPKDLIARRPFYYVAVVEGSTNINPEFLKKRK